MKINEPVLGIDFGATKIVAAVYLPGDVEKFEIVLDDQKSRMAPACVAFTDKERLLMHTAVYQASANPENTIFGKDIKTFLHYDVKNDTLKNNSKKTFVALEKIQKSFYFKVTYKNSIKNIAPEHALGMLLVKVKANAERQAKQPLNYCIITVPKIFFQDEERTAISIACEIAGLTVLNIVKDVFAASMTYAMNMQESGPHRLLVIDMGALTLDVAIMEVKKTEVHPIKSLTNDGNWTCGGDLFTQRLVDYFKDEIKEKLDCKNDLSKSQLIRLKDGCENVKKILSTLKSAKVTIETFHNDAAFELSMTLDKFNEICKDLFETYRDTVQKVYSNCVVSVANIDHVIVVGGGGRMPRIQEILKDITGKEPLRVLNQDEAIAMGAAYYASIEMDQKQIRTSTSSSKQLIKRFKSLEQSFQKDEKDRYDTLKTANELEKMCYLHKRSNNTDIVKNKCIETLQWLEQNKENATLDDYQNKLDGFKRFMDMSVLHENQAKVNNIIQEPNENTETEINNEANTASLQDATAANPQDAIAASSQEANSFSCCNYCIIM